MTQGDRPVPKARGTPPCCNIRYQRPDYLAQAPGKLASGSPPQSLFSAGAAAISSPPTYLSLGYFSSLMADHRGGGSRSPRVLSIVRTSTGPTRQYLASPIHSLPVRRLKDILSDILPHVTLLSTEELQSTHLTRLYTLKMSDGKNLVLAFAPNLAVRLLRQESTILSTEATLLNFIAESNILPEKENEKEEKGKGKGKEKGKEENTGPSTTDTDTDTDDEDDEEEAKPIGLSELVPKLLKHSSNNHELAYPYSIIEPTPGEPLSSLAPFITAPERRDIEKQVGTMARALAELISPSNIFGLANKAVPAQGRSVPPSAPPMLGPKTWSEGFNTLLEGILRDGEDMAVLLPYEVIRAHFQRLSWRLDAVTKARLVILDVDDPKNVMVEREPDDEETMLPSENIRMTGLRNWSRGVFGDPLIASCFDDSTEGFQEGWDEGGEDVIEDEENSETRQLLYRCYRAVVEVVTEYYRPKGDSSKRELAGRRKLTQVLGQLKKADVIEDDALKRARKESIAEESSKRIKTEAKNE